MNQLKKELKAITPAFEVVVNGKFPYPEVITNRNNFPEKYTVIQMNYTGRSYSVHATIDKQGSTYSPNHFHNCLTVEQWLAMAKAIQCFSNRLKNEDSDKYYNWMEQAVLSNLDRINATDKWIWNPKPLVTIEDIREAKKNRKRRKRNV